MPALRLISGATGNRSRVVIMLQSRSIANVIERRRLIRSVAGVWCDDRASSQGSHGLARLLKRSSLNAFGKRISGRTDHGCCTGTVLDRDGQSRKHDDASKNPDQLMQRGIRFICNLSYLLRYAMILASTLMSSFVIPIAILQD